MAIIQKLIINIIEETIGYIWIGLKIWSIPMIIASIIKLMGLM